jgi:membrane protein implicated in regulation of membrane protease activity
MNLESLFLYAAIGGGVVLLTQLVMMVFAGDDGGFDDGAGIDPSGIDHSGVDHSGSHHHNNGGVTDASGFWFFEMISLRTLAAAATFFGLVGGAANATGAPPGVSLALAALAGYGAMYAVYWAFKQIFRLETQGNEDVYNAIGKTAEVYIPIAGSNRQAGKVQLTMQGRTVEYQALTDSDHPLATGAKVLVMDVVSNDTVKVAPIPVEVP